MDGDTETIPNRRDWYVLHVKPRTEKKTAAFLRFFKLFYHLPLYLKITKIQRRKVRRELPLFPGYVFTKMFPEERIQMLQTNLIVRTIRVDRPRPMIHQLRQIARALRDAPPIAVRTSMFKKGDLVRVKHGPLYGTEGYVKRTGSKSTLVLNLDILGASVEVTLDASDVEQA